MEFSIIRTKKNHLNEILTLNESFLPAVSSVDINQMNRFLKFADYFKSVLIKNKISGFLIAIQPGKKYDSLNYKWFEKKFESFIYVDRIVIGSEFQDQGIGKAFYEDLQSYASKKTNIITCEVNIKPSNEGSMIFHQKYGFKKIGTQITDNGKKEVCLMAYKMN